MDVSKEKFLYSQKFLDVSKEKYLDRLLFFERERKFAEALYVLNPRDADNLTRWAKALFVLSKAQNNTDSREMRKDAISKLDNALSINSENHKILWCLGNVYCSLAKLYPVGDTSTMYFDMAYGYFKKALDKDPENKLYLTSKQELVQNFGRYFKEMSNNNNKKKAAKKKPKSSDLMYDMFEWVIVAVGIFTWIWIVKSRVPPPPPR